MSYRCVNELGEGGSLGMNPTMLEQAQQMMGGGFGGIGGGFGGGGLAGARHGRRRLWRQNDYYHSRAYLSVRTGTPLFLLGCGYATARPGI